MADFFKNIRTVSARAVTMTLAEVRAMRMRMTMTMLFAVLLAPILSGSAATAWTGPDTLAIVPCGDVSSNGDTLEVDADCENQFIETEWDRDHARQDDPGITAEEDDAESRISAEADVAKDKASGTDGTSESGWMGILPPIAGIAIALIVIIAYRFGKAAKRG